MLHCVWFRGGGAGFETDNAMGFHYLQGRSWAETTREERFFCLQLYNRIVQAGVRTFVQHLRAHSGWTGPLPHPQSAWELGYEVCFYRDLWHQRGRQDPLYSPKRTFDLALFSDDCIIVIEAKAQQGFDVAQLSSFRQDREQIARVTGIASVLLLGLCSSRHEAPAEAQACFDGPLLRWSALAQRFGGDPILQRADDVFEQAAAESFGRNNAGGYQSGEDLLALHTSGVDLWVGRKGGRHGELFHDDLRTGEWRRQRYETRSQPLDHAPRNRNWFRLAEFAQAVQEASSRAAGMR